ncbi:MAG: ParB family transcriptional regulator, chromosome partitioning protein [Thermodesulfobacteriota bacterium]|nr:ParB family transcriptional regulator, chromosome partitioning protein [Thermodesulfobacteriota bacterium]
MSEGQFIHVAPSKFDLSLARLRRCPRTAIEAMISSLERRGQLNPVVAAGHGQHIILVDGFKRQQAASIIGMDKISAVILRHYDRSVLKALIYLLNHNGGFELIEECLIIRELVEKDGFRQVEVATMMERHKSWVSRRLEMVRRLNPQIIEDIRVGLLPPGSARPLARLPECNQVDMGAAIQRDKLKTEEIHRLVDLWRKAANPEQKRFIMGSSRKALELAGADSQVDLSAVPVHLHNFFKTVGSIERFAHLLKRSSSKGLGAMNPQSEAMLVAALGAAENMCREAISCAYSALNRKGGASGESTA